MNTLKALPKEFPDILPGIFSQIVDGIDEAEHQMEAGRIHIKFVDQKGVGKPLITHSGSIQILYIVEKVRTFLKAFPFSLYFKKAADEHDKTILKNVFEQVLSGEAAKDYAYGDSHVLHVNIKIVRSAYILTGGSTLDCTIEATATKKEQPKAGEIPSIELLRQLLGEHGLAKYFGISSKH